MVENFSSLKYVLWRIAGGMTPNFVKDFLMRKSWIIKASDGTNNPKSAVDSYETAVGKLAGKVILEFGYGGCYGTACELIRRGAAHVYLIDKFAKPDIARNNRIFSSYGEYLRRENGKTVPNEKYITLLHGDIADVAKNKLRVDLIFSLAVLEHVDDVESVILALKGITTPGGSQCHFVDLSGHMSGYPFEMLCYDAFFWRNFLNPGSHLNRLRLKDYQAIFNKYFDRVEYKITASELKSFLAVKSRIKPEFLTGNNEIDAATSITIKTS